MLHPKIIEVTTDEQTGEAYVLVYFYRTKAARARGDPPFLIEDFIMQLRLTGTRPIDADNPGLGTEVFARDLDAEIRANIRNFIRDAERYGYEGDNSSQSAVGGAFSARGQVVRPEGRPIQARVRDESDPHGVLAKPEVAALRGKDIDLATVG